MGFTSCCFTQPLKEVRVKVRKVYTKWQLGKMVDLHIMPYLVDFSDDPFTRAVKQAL